MKQKGKVEGLIEQLAEEMAMQLHDQVTQKLASRAVTLVRVAHATIRGQAALKKGQPQLEKANQHRRHHRHKKQLVRVCAYKECKQEFRARRKNMLYHSTLCGSRERNGITKDRWWQHGGKAKSKQAQTPPHSKGTTLIPGDPLRPGASEK